MNTVLSPRPQPDLSPRDDVRVLLGSVLRDLGKLTEAEVTQIVQAQRTSKRRFGETAVQLGLLEQRDLQVALARQYGYPCLAMSDTRSSPALYTATEPFERQSEAVRTLRSQLSMRWFTDRRKSLAVTAVGSEDSSELAANLAISFAQLGERVALIDANLRNPRQHLLFGLDPSTGLSALLNGRSEIHQVLAPVPSIDNLSVIGAGAEPPNPQELLGRISFSYLVETAPAMFDIVIIDTPPILACADAQLVATLVGGCLLVARRHVTRVRDVEEVRRHLGGLRVDIVGAVVLD